ncbi:MAG: hypothetical protein LBR80_14820 [Deltaproteobacteria bacterium]|nr:hypothetical protein [Deltaproteobacteria bacterium]
MAEADDVVVPFARRIASEDAPPVRTDEFVEDEDADPSAIQEVLGAINSTIASKTEAEGFVPAVPVARRGTPLARPKEVQDLL